MGAFRADRSVRLKATEMTVGLETESVRRIQRFERNCACWNERGTYVMKRWAESTCIGLLCLAIEHNEPRFSG